MVLAVIVTGVGRVTVCQPLAAVLVKVALARLVPVAGPQIEEVRAGVAGAAIELERGDLAGNGGLELHADFERRAVVQIGLRRGVGRGEQADRWAPGALPRW